MGGLVDGLLTGMFLGWVLWDVILPAWVAVRRPRGR